MDGYLSLFGENLIKRNTIQPGTLIDSGIRFSDTEWENAVIENSKIRKTGFVPSTPSSSLALNTALYQGSVGARIIDTMVKAVANSNVDITDVNAVEQTIIPQFTAYLKQLYDLINTGSVVGYITRNYNLQTGTIKEKFDSFETQLNEVRQTINNIRNLSVYCAEQYFYDDDGTIKTKPLLQAYKDLSTRMLGTSSMYNSAGILINGTIPSTLSNVSGTVFKDGDVAHGTLILTVNEAITVGTETICQFRNNLKPKTDVIIEGYISHNPGAGVIKYGSSFTLHTNGTLTCGNGLDGNTVQRYDVMYLSFGYQTA